MIAQSKAQNAVLVGLGMVADMHVTAIKHSHAGVRLIGIHARRPDQARAFAARTDPDLRVYERVKDITTDPDVDFVILATPPDARAEYVAALAAARIPVLMEKPIERDSLRAAALVDQYGAADLPLGVVLQHRMRPAALELLARVNSGALGRISTVETRVPWWRGQEYYDAPGRGTYARDGGGVLITQAIHAIDLMLTLCGPAAQVQALTATSPLHRMESEDFAAAAITFASGAVGSLMASTTHFPGGGDEIILNATRASAHLSANQLTIHWQDGRQESFGTAAATGGGADPMAFTHDWHRLVIDDFATALANNRPPAITGRSALGAQFLIDAIVQSSRSGFRVDLTTGA